MKVSGAIEIRIPLLSDAVVVCDDTEEAALFLMSMRLDVEQAKAKKVIQCQKQ
jgi:hypothetical protein